MTFRIEFSKDAEKGLSRVDNRNAQRIVDKLGRLADNVDAVQHEHLSRNLKGFLKLRMGNYRVVYVVDNNECKLIVHFVGHRRDVYNIN